MKQRFKSRDKTGFLKIILIFSVAPLLSVSKEFKEGNL
jgi:hypothetical protein